MQTRATPIIEELGRRFRPALMAFFLRRVRNHAEAEDLTHEILLKVIERGAAIDAGRPDGYIFQMAANLLRDRGRRDKLWRLYQAGYGAVVASATDEEDPYRALCARQSLDTVLDVLDSLPQRTRTIFMLFRMEHMKQTDIANILGVSVKTVEYHLAQATVALRERFKAEP